MLIAPLFIALCGCNQLAAILAVASGGDTVDAEYKFDETPLAIIVDNPDDYDIAPEATRALHEDLVRQLEVNKVKCTPVPFEDIQRLRTGEPQYDDLSVRAIGEKLGADQVLYLRVQYWATKENPGDPQFRGSAKVNVKVISTERKRDVRLWPKGATEKTASAQTDPQLTDASGAEVQVSRQLAAKLADTIAKYFYDHKPQDE